MSDSFQKYQSGKRARPNPGASDSDPTLIDSHILLGFGAALTLVEDAEEIAHLTAGVIASALRIPLGALVLQDAHDSEIRVLGQFRNIELGKSLAEEIENFLTSPPPNSSLLSNADSREIEVQKENLPESTAAGLRRLLLVRLRTIDHDFGAVIAGKSSEEPFLSVQTASLQALASQTTMALHRVQLSLERKQAEKALQEAHDELEHRVEERTAELAKANAMLKAEITERKRAAEALEQLQRHNELILSSAGEGIYGLDKNGNTTFVNPAATEILGWQPEEMIGKPQHGLIHHSKPDGSSYVREECPIYAAFSDGLVHTVTNEVFWRKDGTSLPVEYTSTPILDEEDCLVGAVVTFRDITRRKQAEKALRDALQEVEQLKDQLQAENVYLQEEIKHEHNFDNIISISASFKKVFRNVEQVATTDATVLILGETGTGKELIARALHTLSSRKERPLVKVNCAALPVNLIESELFGHEKGAFTGALARRQGRFELADCGTIFLDEIGDLPLDLQAKLLRVLQEGEFERVGGSQTLRVDARVIAATNRDLEQASQSGEFREDLFYRLNVFPITCPPLRERKEDIPILVTHFIQKYGTKLGKKIETIPQKVTERLLAYDWPGNVRELENTVERALIISGGKQLELGDWLPRTGVSSKAPELATPELATMEELERKHIIAVLEMTGWRVRGEKGAAKILGLNPTTLEARMKKLGIKRQE